MMARVNLNQQRRRAAYGRWQLELAVWIGQRRGRASELARWLGVSRQQVSRWFVRPTYHWTRIPAWAAVSANVFFGQNRGRVHSVPLRVVTPQADKSSGEVS